MKLRTRFYLLGIQIAALSGCFLSDFACASNSSLKPPLPIQIEPTAIKQLHNSTSKQVMSDKKMSQRQGTFSANTSFAPTSFAFTRTLQTSFENLDRSTELELNKKNAQHAKQTSIQTKQSLAKHLMQHKNNPQTTPRINANTPITLEFQQAELSTVLQAFARFTGLNIIASQQVHGTVSMRLNQVPWRRAFDLLLDSHGLAMQRRGNIIWVAPIQELVQRERQRFETQTKTAELEPLTSQIFELRYQRAENIRKLLSGSGTQRILSKRGAAMADERTNQLFVTDVAEYIQKIRTLLLAIDQPTKQVSIEARIVEADQGFSQSLGARLSLLGAGGRMNDSSPSNEFASRHFVVANKGKGKGEGKNTNNSTIYNLPASPLVGFAPAMASTTLFGAAASRLIALELSMLESEGKGQLLSSPRVVTADRTKALIEQGTELPYQAKVGNGVSGVQFRRAGLKLEVTPNITPNGYVILDIDVAKDSVGENTSSGPAINTKHVQTQVQVENGGTVAIGGIFTQDQRTDVVRVPWLGRLPFIGALFRRSVKSDRKSELLVFITPNIVTSTPNLNITKPLPT